MQALMLIAESAALLPEFRRKLAHAFPSELISSLANEEEFVIEFSTSSRAYVQYYGSSLADWDEVDIARIQEALPATPHVYSLAYRGIETAKKVIIQLADSSRMMVDNDCGTLLRGTDFVRKVIEQPTWYWFDDLQ